MRILDNIKLQIQLKQQRLDEENLNDLDIKRLTKEIAELKEFMLKQMLK